MLPPGILKLSMELHSTPELELRDNAHPQNLGDLKVRVG